MGRDVKLTMVGTGSATGYKYFSTSCLVETEDYNLLIDCGETTPHGLYTLGYDFSQLDGVVITHIHGDNVNGLEKLARTFRYGYNRKLDLIGESNLLYRLWENTLRGGLEESEEGRLSFSDFFNLVPIRKFIKMEKGSFHGVFYWETIELTPSLKLELVQTEHISNKDSFSLFINDSIFYSGDIRFDPNLYSYLIDDRGVEVIFQDCQLHDHSESHASLSKLLTLDERLQGYIWLMHYDDNMEDFIGKTGKMRFLEQGKTYTFLSDGSFIG